MAAEVLEARAMLAVTADLVGGDLLISYNEPGDLAADISSDGGFYTVSGTGLAATQFAIGGPAGVTGRIVVQDSAAIFGQSFTVETGTPLANPLQVNAGVELTTLVGGILTSVPGDVLLGSGVITLGNTISTTLTGSSVTFGGATTLAGPVAISTGGGSGDISFQGTIDGGQTLSLTAGIGNVIFGGAVGGGTPLAGISLTSAASMTAASTIALDGTLGLATDGITIDAGVNRVSLTKAGSSIQNFSANGIWFKGGSTESTISGFTIKGNGGDGVRLDAGGYSGTTISNNSISDNDGNGVRLTAATGPVSIAENLKIDLNGLNGVYAENSTTVSIVGNSIVGNTFHGVSVPGGGGVIFGNEIGDNGSNGVMLAGGYDVADNLISLNDRHGIEVVTGLTSLDIIGNTINGNALDGIFFDAGGVTGFEVSGNAIYGNKSDGIQADNGDYTGTAIQGNELYENVQNGIFLNATAGLTGLLIGGVESKYGNEIYANTKNGVFVAGSTMGATTFTDTKLLLNTIDSNGEYGVFLEDARAPGFADGLLIGRNNVTANVAGGIALDTSTGHRIIGNTVTGYAAPPAVDGISLADRSDANVVYSNVVTANGGNGIVVDSSDGVEVGGVIGGFTTTAGGTVLTLAGDQTALILPGMQVGLAPPVLDPPLGVLRSVVAVSLVGGSTQVTVSAAMDTTSTSGTLGGSNTADGNGSDGIVVENSFPTLIVGNVATGNAGAGIAVSGGVGTIAGNVAAGNGSGIGLGGGYGVSSNNVYSNAGDGILVATGLNDLPINNNWIYDNGGNGISFTGGVTGFSVFRNDIGQDPFNNPAGNGGFGVRFDAGDYSGTQLFDNKETTGVEGGAIAYNTLDGIFLNASSSPNGAITGLTIGGTKDDGNSIHDNGRSGILVSAGSYTGTTIQGNELYQNTDHGVFLSVNTTAGLTGLLIGGDQNGLGNWIDSNGRNGILAQPTAGGAGSYADTVIVGNEVTRNRFDGIRLAGGATNLSLTGNLIGTRAVDDSAIAWGNLQSGVRVRAGDYANTVIQGNELKGNGEYGVSLDAAGGDLTGLLIGGEQAGLGNWMDSNGRNGVLVRPTGGGVSSYADTVIVGNEVTRNRFDGVRLVGDIENLSLTGNWIGTRAVDDLVTKWGNLQSGVRVRAGDYAGTTIQGNEIKTNGAQGVFLERGVTNLLVGGERADLGNRINLNSRNGILATAGSYTGTVIVGNMILDNGDKAGRVGNGILVEGSDLTIGWTDQAGEPNPVANTIAANALNGIEIRGVAAKANSILSNAMYLNGAVDTGVPGAQTVAGKGIALTEGGNDGQAAPVILRVVDDAVGSVVRVLATVPASGSYYVQVFANTPADERGIFPADTNGFEGRMFVADSPAQNGEPLTTAKPMIAGVLVTGETLVMIEIPASRVAPGDWLTATATRVEGGIAGSTSPFSAGVQLPNAPVLAAGGDGPSTWSPEYPFTTLSPSQIQVDGLSAAYQEALASLRNVAVVLTPVNAAAGGNVVTTVLQGRISGGSVILDLAPGAPSAPSGAGTFALGSVTLPAARLYDASQPMATPVLLNLGATGISRALLDAGVEQGAADAFVNRFQGGLRVAHADIDGDGFADLVTAPGAAPPALNEVFGNATRVVSIYNGNVGSDAWRSASVNVSEVFGTTYTGGFTLALADVNPERSGSGSAVAELVVASTNMVAVFEVTVTTRGGQPAINSTPLVTWASSARVTGVTAGDFSEAETDEIVVATTTILSGNAVPPEGDSTRTAAVVTMAVVGQQLVPRKSFTIWSEVVNGPPGPGYVQNVFYNGALLAVGDIDGTIVPGADGIRLRPELVLAVGPMGLANFRVLANQLVAGGSQTAIDEALGPNGLYAQPPRQPDGATWQPTGGPDYFVGTTVPVPIAGGANAALSVAVVDTDGRANARAEVFAAIGATTTTNNVVRKLVWGGPTVGSWAAVGEFMVRPGAGSLAKTKFPLGFGLRLG